MTAVFGFFKKKQDTPCEQSAVETPASETPIPVKPNRQPPDKEFFANDPYAVSIKRAGFRFLQERGDAFEAEHVFDLIGGLMDIEAIRSQLENSAWRSAQDIIQKGNKAESDRAKHLAVAETAMRIDRVLNTYDDDTIEHAVKTAEVDTLVKAYIAVDYGSFPLKPEACVNLRYTEGRILEELRRRGVVVKGPIDHVREQLHHAVKNSADETVVNGMMKQLFSLLVGADRIYIATDEDFNPRFAHIAFDGRAEVFTTRELAERFVDHAKCEKLGLTGVREVQKGEIAAWFEELYEAGVQVFRLDNGTRPVDIPLAKVLPEKNRFFIDDAHRETRGCFLRELQYGYRLQKTPVGDKEQDRLFKESVLTMRSNGYRLLGRGLLYVLLPDNGKSAVTYYTKEALNKAKAVIKEKGLTTKALLVDGDDAYAEYEGPLRLRVVQLPGESTEKALVCVFTDYRVACEALERFRQNGVNDRPVVMTWDEISRVAQHCAGVMVDLPTYGRQLKKEEFGEIFKFREIDKPIVMRLNEPNGKKE